MLGVHVEVQTLTSIQNVEVPKALVLLGMLAAFIGRIHHSDKGALEPNHLMAFRRAILSMFKYF